MAPLAPLKTSDIFLHLPNNIRPSQTVQDKPLPNSTLLFFVPGNPGLISYYHTFFHFLTLNNHDPASTTPSNSAKNLAIAGFSLANFETTTEHQRSGLENELLYPPSQPAKINGEPYTLQKQITICYARLTHLVARLREQQGQTGQINVILAGHSVGAYIALEIARLTYEDFERLQSQSQDGSGAETRQMTFRIVTTMLLTPTIHDISLSPSGRVATPVLAVMPWFPALLQISASALVATLPVSWLRAVVARVTGMKSEDAMNATVGFLRTPGAVRQALFMAGCEMREIREGKWKEEIWGASVGAVETRQGLVSDSVGAEERVQRWKSPRHYFLFARTDHWVADVTRDEIVKAQAALGEDAGRVLVDTDGKMGIVHAWCLEKSEVVALIVEEWIAEVKHKIRD